MVSRRMTDDEITGLGTIRGDYREDFLVYEKVEVPLVIMTPDDIPENVLIDLKPIHGSKNKPMGRVFYLPKRLINFRHITNKTYFGLSNYITIEDALSFWMLNHGVNEVHYHNIDTYKTFATSFTNILNWGKPDFYDKIHPVAVHRLPINAWMQTFEHHRYKEKIKLEKTIEIPL